MLESIEGALFFDTLLYGYFVSLQQPEAEFLNFRYLEIGLSSTRCVIS